MSPILSKKQMTEEDIKLQYITPAITSKWNKNDKILRIKEPHCFAIVNSNGKYKILVGYLDHDWMLRCDKLFITEHFETVVDLLDIYIEEYPENINKEYALKNNNGLFRDRAFCRALAITPDEHFKDLDALCGN